jgi:GH25 family lysozyme M1 (1,4-beta-N-acetylmuramidase)
MNGIDISGHQQGIDLSVVPCDFVIIKATQGVSFVSKDFKRQTEQALGLRKLVGLYHYANGAGVDGEADHFVETIKPYLGHAILCLDWEGEQNSKFSDYHYCESLLEAIQVRTGRVPFLYMSKSVCRQYKWEKGRQYPLWVAQYANYSATGYQDNPWTDKKGYGAWKAPFIFQYSSCGRLKGYNKNLDLDIAYITPDQWKMYAGDNSDESIKPILRKGDRNEYVRSWQRYLNVSGFNCGDADGIFGDKTEQAVIKYQQSKGMESGYIGEQTWATIS